jgi:hypothetical protein
MHALKFRVKPTQKVWPRKDSEKKLPPQPQTTIDLEEEADLSLPEEDDAGGQKPMEIDEEGGAPTGKQPNEEDKMRARMGNFVSQRLDPSEERLDDGGGTQRTRRKRTAEEMESQTRKRSAGVGHADIMCPTCSINLGKIGRTNHGGQSTNFRASAKQRCGIL